MIFSASSAFGAARSNSRASSGYDRPPSQRTTKSGASRPNRSAATRTGELLRGLSTVTNNGTGVSIQELAVPGASAIMDRFILGAPGDLIAPWIRAITTGTGLWGKDEGYGLDGVACMA